MNHNSKDYEYRQLNSNVLTVDRSYQRDLDVGRVKKIVANFNPNLVNAAKVSYRDGKYYIFDGQHTVAALKLKSGNSSLMIDCKVYRGLTAADEAVLFAEQNGLSRAVEKNARFRALFSAGDIDVVSMVQLTESAGLLIDFTKSKAENKITVVSKAFRIFKDTSESDYLEILEIIKQAWNGEPDSLSSEILGGMHLFQSTYKGRYDKDVLIKHLETVSPLKIYRDGKVYSDKGDKKYARQILIAYNKGLSSNKLPDKL